MVSHFFRRYQQPLLIVLTVLIIIAFTTFFDRRGFAERGRGATNATIYGRTVSSTEISREQRKFELAGELAMRDRDLQQMLMFLAQPGKTRDEATQSFIWNSIILRHEADQLGITATDEEVAEEIQGLAAFQTNGVFDMARYEQILKPALNSRGLDRTHLDALLRDQVRLKKIMAILGSTTAAAPTEIRATFDRENQKYDASVVRLTLGDFLKTATASDEEVQKLYEGRKDQLKSDEMRKVRYVAFKLPKEDKPLEGQERLAAKGKLGQQAEDFSVAMTEKGADFAAVAEKAGVKVEETEPFTRNEPPPALAEVPAAAAMAFRLTPEQPNADIITVPDGYYIIQLAGITEARPLTLEEAKPKLVDELKLEQAREAMNLKGAELHKAIEAELKNGKTFAEAVQAAGAKSDVIPEFSLRTANRTSLNNQEAMMTVVGMKAGELSDFKPTMAGGMVVYLGKITPPDDAAFAAEKATVEQNFADFTSAALFIEWLNQRRAEANFGFKRG